jgi:predicted small lipoprotein YifL
MANKYLIGLALVALLSACGNKGALYLPVNEPPQQVNDR